MLKIPKKCSNLKKTLKLIKKIEKFSLKTYVKKSSFPKHVSIIIKRLKFPNILIILKHVSVALLYVHTSYFEKL